MWRYICKRLILIIPVMLGVTLLIFALLYIVPGDPAELALGEAASDAAKFEWREKFGLNEPFFTQFFNFLKGILLEGDLGKSYTSGVSVSATLATRFPITISVAILSTLITAVLGVVLGVLAANHAGSWVDDVIRVLSMAGISMPVFWLGLLLILLFSVKLRWLPVSGWYGPVYWILPVLTMAISHSASLVRMTRSSMLECIRQDYVRTARAKGQSEKKITWHHIFRNALIPVLTNIGTLFAVGLSGAVLLESIFAIPGIGKMLIDAVGKRDFATVRAGVLVIALSISIVNLLVDLGYAAIDPRIKARFKSSVKQKKAKEAVKA